MRKKNLIMSIIGLFTFIFLAGGVSFAYFVYNKDIAVVDLETGKISINFNNATNTIGNDINQPLNDGLGQVMPNYLDFNVNGVTDTESIYYEIYIVPNDASTIDSKYINIYLTDQNENKIHGVSPLNLLQPSKINNGYLVYSDVLVANNSGTIKNYDKNFRIRVWLNDSYKEGLSGNFNYSVYMYAMNIDKINFMNTFPTEITDLKTSVKEIYFKNDTQSIIDDKCQAAANNGGVCKDITYQNQGNVKAWLEPIENDMYNMYVESDGKTYWNTGRYLLAGFTNVSKIVFENVDTLRCLDFAGMFNNCKNLNSIDLSSFNTINVRNISWMFTDCRKLKNIDLGSFDTGNVIDLSSMFQNCYELTSIDLLNFNTFSAEYMSCLFYNCEDLETILLDFDTRNVKDFSRMFACCRIIESLDFLTNFDTHNAINMANMFYGCYKIRNLDLTNFDTSHVTNMEGMLYSLKAVTVLDLSSFDTSNVRNMSNMFWGDENLVTVYVSDLWSTASVTESTEMFKYVNNIIGGNNTRYNSELYDYTYAQVDGRNGSPGYFTDISNK